MWGGLTGLLVALGGNVGRKIDQNKPQSGSGIGIADVILMLVFGLPLAFFTWVFPIPMGIVDVILLAIIINAFRQT